jgi:Icc-related predicted phosphoesterase
MNIENDLLRSWLKNFYPNVKLLLDEEISIQGVNFFGGTMWTDFSGGDERAMSEAQKGMNDFRLIRTESGQVLLPADTITLHNTFKEKLLAWFEKPLSGSRVVITHHAPVLNPDSVFGGSALMPAFNSLDMVDVIQKYQPEFWFYGHTHECDRQSIGKTQIICG